MTTDSKTVFDFEGQTVIVTGAARGIGAEVSRHFAKAGADVCVLDVDEKVLVEAAAGFGGHPSGPTSATATT